MDGKGEREEESEDEKGRDERRGGVADVVAVEVVDGKEEVKREARRAVEGSGKVVFLEDNE